VRAPFQILVLPFRRTPTGELEVAVFLRRDERYWQGIAGGGEDAETPFEAARREAYEEAGIPPECPYYPLEAVAMVTVGDRVVPEHCFAVDAGAHAIRLSDEHTDARWVSADVAQTMLRWESNRVALRELCATRLRA
jgi:dihydroneopterin triphosphate diphosphatase